MASATVQSTLPRNGLKLTNSKTSIPLINNVVTDNTLRKISQPHQTLKPLKNYVGGNVGKDSYLIKVLKLLTEKHYDGFTDRQCQAIKKIPKYFGNGIHVREVHILSEIISRCSQLIHSSGKVQYEESLKLLVSVFSVPFLESKTSDEVTYLEKVAAVLSKVGIHVKEAPDAVKISFALAILSLYTAKSSEEEIYDVKPVSETFVKLILEKSTVCESIGDCFTKVLDTDGRLVILKTLKALSDSGLKCDDMLKSNVAQGLCSMLKENMDTYNTLLIATETLWNILELGSNVLIKEQLSNEGCLRCLHETFLHRAKKTSSQAYRQLRNDILILISLLISKCPKSPYLECGISKSMALYASLPNISILNDSKKTVAQCFENFEMKKILFCIIAQLCTDKQTLGLFSKLDVMLTLFSYVKAIKEPLDVAWTLSEFEELQLHAMAVLETLAPLCVDDYMNCQGNTRLLLLLDWCVGGDDYGGHGNSFHGSGGRGSKRAQMRYCIRLLRSVCSTGNQSVYQDLKDQGAITQLVAILTSSSCSTESNDKVDIELQCDMMFILSTVCDGNLQRKQIFGECGVLMTVQYLNGYLKDKNGPLNHQNLVLSATDCIWSAVQGCYSNEVTFLQNEGLFLLFDLLEICPDNMQNLTLGVILDLMENKKALPHVLLWKGNKHESVSKLMIEIWKAEEIKLGTSRDECGVITDADQPLLTKMQVSQEFVTLPTSLPTTSIIDIFDNLRAKIYSFFSKIGFNNTNELLPEDFVYLTIIEKYLDFKTMEIWQEINRELEYEKIIPVEEDQDIIDQIILTFRETAIEVIKIQRSLIENNDNEELRDEQIFYRKVAEGYTQGDKTYNDFMNYKERTSNFNALLLARQEQLEDIERSKMFTNSTHMRLEISTPTHHETFDKSLHTTTFCGRNITVRSTDMKLQDLETN